MQAVLLLIVDYSQNSITSHLKNFEIIFIDNICTHEIEIYNKGTQKDEALLPECLTKTKIKSN